MLEQCQSLASRAISLPAATADDWPPPWPYNGLLVNMNENGRAAGGHGTMYVFGRWLISAGRTCALVMLAVWLATATPSPARAQDVAAAAITGANPVAPAELVVANRRITTLRAMAFGASPADRVEAITDGLAVLLERGGPLVVAARPITGGVAIHIDGSFAFRILAGEVNPDAG